MIEIHDFDALQHLLICNSTRNVSIEQLHELPEYAIWGVQGIKKKVEKYVSMNFSF